MNTAATRIWTFATVIAIILIVALGWFLGAAPLLAQAASANLERIAVEAQNTQARATLAELERDAARLAELRGEVAALETEFPPGPDYAGVIDELLRELAPASVVLESVSLTEPLPADPEFEASEEGTLPRGTLLSLSVTVQVAGTLDDALAYADAIQRSPRFAIVSAANFSTASGEVEADTVGSTSLTLTLYVITGESRAAGEEPSEQSTTDTDAETDTDIDTDAETNTDTEVDSEVEPQTDVEPEPAEE